MSSDKPSNYFGSDLNKWLHEECNKEMTVNNIDIIQYKRSLKILRIIESKHSLEKMPASQKEVLDILKEIFDVYSKTKNPKYNAQVYIIRGDQPYSESIVTNISKNKKIVMKGKDFKNWCEFKKGDSK